MKNFMWKIQKIRRIADYMSRETNVEIFKDTEKLIRTNKKLMESVKKSTEQQKLIREDDKVMVPSIKKYEDDARVIVSKKRTFEAASAYRQLRTAVHNFASASNPGGGVVRGAGAQEECLCRCSGLYFNLNVQPMWDDFYGPHRLAHNPIHNDDIIYTPSVTVFKSDTANRLYYRKKSGMTSMLSLAQHQTCGKIQAMGTIREMAAQGMIRIIKRFRE